MSNSTTVNEEEKGQLFQRLSIHLAKHGLELSDLPDTDTTELTSLFKEIGITSAVERAQYRRAIKARYPIAAAKLVHWEDLDNAVIDVASLGSCSEAEPAAEAETEPSPLHTCTPKSPVDFGVKNLSVQGLSAALAAHTLPSFPDQPPCNEDMDPKRVLQEVLTARQTADAAFSKLQVVLSALADPDATSPKPSGAYAESRGLQGPS